CEGIPGGERGAFLHEVSTSHGIVALEDWSRGSDPFKQDRPRTDARKRDLAGRESPVRTNHGIPTQRGARCSAVTRLAYRQSVRRATAPYERSRARRAAMPTPAPC